MLESLTDALCDTRTVPYEPTSEVGLVHDAF
jgi:hypothetical protein